MAHLTAIILAAGESSRMGGANKLLLPLNDKTILEHVVDTVGAAGLDDVVVVSGHEDRQIRDLLSDASVRVAYNPEYAQGMSTSIRRGLLAVREETDGFMICLGDMPFLSTETLIRLRTAFLSQEQPSIVVASHDGRRGHPVVFHRSFRDALMQLQGDVGARDVMDAHPGAVVEVAVSDDGIFRDIDTHEAYESAQSDSD